MNYIVSEELCNTMLVNDFDYDETGHMNFDSFWVDVLEVKQKTCDDLSLTQLLFFVSSNNAKFH